MIENLSAPLLLIIGYTVLYLILKKILLIDFEKRRLLFIFLIIFSPFLYLFNDMGNMIIGILLGWSGLYFLAINFFIISISYFLTLPFLEKFSPARQPVLIFIASFLIAPIFILPDLLSYFKTEYIQVKVEQFRDMSEFKLKKNNAGKTITRTGAYFEFGDLLLNPFAQKFVVGASSFHNSYGYTTWSTPNILGVKRLNNFASYFDNVRIKNDTPPIDESIGIEVSGGNIIVEFYKYRQNFDHEKYLKVIISGFQTRETVGEENLDRLQQVYLSRSMDLFLHDNLFIKTYALIYDTMFKQKRIDYISNVVEKNILKSLNKI